MRTLAILLFLTSSAAAGPCVDAYTELANRQVNSFAAYLQYEKDYIAQNIATARRMPLRELHPDETNWQSNSAILKAEAVNRARAPWCIGEGVQPRTN